MSGARILPVLIAAKHDSVLIDCDKHDLRTLLEVRRFLVREGHCKTVYQWGDQSHDFDNSEDVYFLGKEKSFPVQSERQIEITHAFIEQLPALDELPSQPKLILQVESASVIVRHLGKPVDISGVSAHTPIHYIKYLYTKACHSEEANTIMSVDLSFSGHRLPDDSTYAAIWEDYLRRCPSEQDRAETPSPVLLGQYKIVVRDYNCDQDVELAISQYTTVRQIKQLFAQKAKRFAYSGTSLYFDNALLSDDPNAGSVTAYKAQIDEADLSAGKRACVLEFRNPEWDVVAREDDIKLARTDDERKFGSRVRVYDHMTVRELRDSIGEITRRPLTAADKLYFEDDDVQGISIDEESDAFALASGRRGQAAARVQSRELSDEHPLYRYGMRHGCRVRIVRDRVVADFEYLCGKCGKDVSLKRSDQVRCRHCGHRVLLKKRTINPNFAHVFKCE